MITEKQAKAYRYPNLRSDKTDELHKIPKLLLKPVGRAIADFDMIKTADKILSAVSGYFAVG